MTTLYIPVTCNLIGNLDQYVCFHSDLGRTFENRWDANSWGVDELGHDDFRIATVTDGRLTAIGWGEKDFGPDEEDLGEIAGQLGYEVAA